MQEIKPERSQG